MECPWAHLDIAGTAWGDDAKPYRSKGPTGNRGPDAFKNRRPGKRGCQQVTGVLAGLQ
jgi:hypothetical protein